MASSPLPRHPDDFYGVSYLQLAEIGVTDAHRAGYTGAGIRLMMIDTGYRTGHDAFAHTDVVAEWDFLNGDGQTDNEPGDEPSAYDHGTITWSAVGATARGTLIGAAYGAGFLLAKTEQVGGEYGFERCLRPRRQGRQRRARNGCRRQRGGHHHQSAVVNP